MNTPNVQIAIRLTDFVVASMELNNDNPSDPTVTKELELEIDLSLGFSKEENTKSYTVNYHINMKNEENTFALKLTAIAFFESQHEITEDFKKSGFVKINSPAIGFPFVRSFINTLTTNAGLNPIILPSYNFRPENTDNQ